MFLVYLFRLKFSAKTSGLIAKTDLFHFTSDINTPQSAMRHKLKYCKARVTTSSYNPRKISKPRPNLSRPITDSADKTDLSIIIIRFKLPHAN